MQWTRGVATPSNGAAPTSLGHGAPHFELVRWQDLPATWRRPVERGQLVEAAESYECQPDQLEAEVLVEVPDQPWGWAYFRWANEVLDLMTERARAAYLRPMLDPAAEFAAGDRAAQRRLLEDLVRHRRPAPYYVRMFKLRGGDDNAGSETQ
jgi:hypothetical protein